MFNNKIPTKTQKELIDKLIQEENDNNKIKNGIEKTEVHEENLDDKKEEM